ncbi:MAG: GntR family transcriptional regulator [Flavobacteriales bacterium]|nr:GntR family transcriptional regulator [Flavobacteriales bacterium]
MDLFDQKKENKSLTTLIFEKIREDIINDVYKNDEKIIEAKVAEEMGVSRTPVREAIKQLELDGLVENIPNRGVIVKGVTPQDIEDIYTMRLAIEGIAAKWSVERMSEDSLKDLKDIYELMEFYTVKKDIEKIFELNTRFHEVIYKASSSHYLEHVLTDFQQFIKSTRKISLATEGRVEEALKEHKKILDAFLAKDIKAATDALVYHIEHSKCNAGKMIERTTK